MPPADNIDKLRAVLSDKYEIVCLIASGGMGEVYLGIHRVLGKKRAIKIIHQSVGKDKDIRQRFLQEAKLAASIDHPGVVQIMDFGSHEAFDYLIMPYIEGVTLADEMEKGPYAPEAALALMIEMADALFHVHRRQIIHRDIKPSNFMINEEGRVILTDFGISKNIGDPGLTATHMVMGSPRFMSPEQITGKEVDPSSDLYALGMIFYQMVTGQYPFEAPDMAALAYRQVNESPPPPSRVHPDVPEPLGAVILKLLEKKPADRYPGCDALLCDLQSLRESGMQCSKELPAEDKGSAIADMKTRLMTRRSASEGKMHPLGSRGVAEAPAGKPTGREKIGWKTRRIRERFRIKWVIPAALASLGLLLLLIFYSGGAARIARLFPGWGAKEPVLRDAKEREDRFIAQIENHTRPLAASQIRKLGRLETHLGAAAQGGKALAEELRSFLSASPFVRLAEKGGFDVLIEAKDHALGKKLVITSNLYACPEACSEELTIDPRRIPVDKVEQILKRNYCFHLYGALARMSGGGDRQRIDLEVPGKEENVFLVGETVKFCMKPGFDAAVMLLDVNIEGIFKLFPLDPQQRGMFLKDESGCSREIKVSPPMGNELIVAVGCAEEGLIERYSRQYDPQIPVYGWSWKEEAASSAVRLSEAVFGRLVHPAAGRWSVKTRFIRVLNSR
jgi:tRNA A-37 threonylcarbamoyl transferase component Bud32